MKKIVVLLAFLLSINIAQAMSIDVETGRDIIINNEKICLDNITQITYSDINKETMFLLINGDIKYVPTTYNEFIRIQQMVWNTMRFR